MPPTHTLTDRADSFFSGENKKMSSKGGGASGEASTSAMYSGPTPSTVTMTPGKNVASGSQERERDGKQRALQHQKQQPQKQHQHPNKEESGGGGSNPSVADNDDDDENKNVFELDGDENEVEENIDDVVDQNNIIAKEYNDTLFFALRDIYDVNQNTANIYNVDPHNLRKAWEMTKKWRSLQQHMFYGLTQMLDELKITKAPKSKERSSGGGGGGSAPGSSGSTSLSSSAPRSASSSTSKSSRS